MGFPAHLGLACCVLNFWLFVGECCGAFVINSRVSAAMPAKIIAPSRYDNTSIYFSLKVLSSLRGATAGWPPAFLGKSGVASRGLGCRRWVTELTQKLGSVSACAEIASLSPWDE